MMWAKRHLGEGEDYTTYQKRVADLHFMALSLQFVMVAKRTGRAGWDIYIGLPDEFFRSQFDGFGLIDETELPREVDQILYAPNQGVGSEFAKHFRIVESVTAQRFS
jgi:hypothetical protein